MLTLNPCSFYQEYDPIPFHRNLSVLLIIIDISLLLLLRLLTLFLRNGHKQRIDDIVKRNAKKEVIKVEEIKVNFKEQSDMVLNSRSLNQQIASLPSNLKLAKKAQTKEESQNSSQQSEIQNQQDDQEKEKYLIDLKKLKMTESQFINTYVMTSGIRFVCLSFAMLYYPFIWVSLLALLQTLLKMINLILRLCGYQGKILTILNGIAFCCNTIILGLSIYGLETRVPKNDGTSCFDLF